MSDREMAGGSPLPSSGFGSASMSGGGGTAGGSMGESGQGWQTGSQGSQGWQTGEQGSQAGGQGGGSAVDQAKETATQAVDTVRERAGQVTEQVTTRADQGIDVAASGLDRAADMLRERSQGMGGEGSGMQATATQLADRLDTASQYLRDKDSQQLMTDLEELVRRKPTESLLVAAGVGFLLSKVLR